MIPDQLAPALLIPWAIAAGYLPAALPEELQNQGIVGYRELEDGRILTVMPLLFGRARLCLGNGPNAKVRPEWDTDGSYEYTIGYDGGFDEYRDFDTVTLACEAMMVWTDWEQKP